MAKIEEAGTIRSRDTKHKALPTPSLRPERRAPPSRYMITAIGGCALLYRTY